MTYDEQVKNTVLLTNFNCDCLMHSSFVKVIA